MNMSVDYGLIGRRIKQMRKNLGRTQEDLADYMRVSVGYVSQIERGVTKINLDTLSNISNFLGCEVADFLSNATTVKNGYLSKELEEIYAQLTREQKQIVLKVAEMLIGVPCGEDAS